MPRLLPPSKEDQHLVLGSGGFAPTETGRARSANTQMHDSQRGVGDGRDAHGVLGNFHQVDQHDTGTIDPTMRHLISLTGYTRKTHRRLAFVAGQHHVDNGGAIFGRCWEDGRLGRVTLGHPAYGLAKPNREEGDQEHDAPLLPLRLREDLWLVAMRTGR